MRRRIIYILSYPRSGSTLLGSLLAEVMKCIHVGETFFIWKNVSTGPFPDRGCGCGKRMADCEYWSEVLTKSYSVYREHYNEDIDNDRLFQQRESAFSRTGYAESKVGKFKDFTRILYDQMFKQAGVDLIIDSSKELSYARFLTNADDLDIFYVYLVRDPRGVLLSRQRKLKNMANGNVKLNYPYLAYDAIMLIWKDLLIGRFLRKRRGLRVRYEDLVANPRAVLKMIAVTSGHPITTDVFLEDQSVSLGHNHVAVGNKMKYQRGLIEIKLDERWKRELSVLNKVISWLMVWPLLVKYNYGRVRQK